MGNETISRDVDPAPGTATANESLEADFNNVPTSPVSRLTAKAKRFQVWFYQKLNDLTFSQIFYFAAIIALFSTVDVNGAEQDTALIAGMIALVGLSRELWQLFIKIWDHTLGKGVLFVLYFATANFALAVSALKVNTIAGIEPTILPFTMGFATLLLLPFWIVLASIVFLGTFLVLGNLWLLLCLLLRLIKIKLPFHWEDKSFAVVTLILRLILIPVIIYTLIYAINPYLKQMDMFEEPLEVHFIDSSNLTAAQARELREIPRAEIGAAIERIRKQELGDLAEYPGLSHVPGEQVLADIQRQAAQENGGTSESDTGTQEEESETRFLDKMIAMFIYRFETYQYSRCQKEPQQRILAIDEDSMFVAELDRESATGVVFSVAACEPDYGQRALKRILSPEPAIPSDAAETESNTPVAAPADTGTEPNQGVRD